MRLRAPAPDDAEAVLGVIAARDLADLGVIDFTLEDLRHEWAAPEFELAADAVLAEAEDGVVAGYAAVRRPGTSVVVAPGFEGRGIGGALVEWGEARERALGRTCHRRFVAGGDDRGRALLLGAGYRFVRSYWRMARPLSAADAGEFTPPPGRRALRPGADAAALHALDALSFADGPDYDPQSLATFTQEHLGAPDLVAELSSVVVRDQQPIAFLLARCWEDESTGFVDLLAVHPDHRRRGLGEALLRTAFAGFATAGLREAQLGVASDNPRALALYERVGMTPRFRVDVYERELDPALRPG